MTVRSIGPTASVRPPDLPRRTRVAVRGTPDSRRWSGVLTGLAELPLLLLAALVMAFLLKTLLVQAFYIPSGSMIPTLQINDRVLVEKVTYRLRRPERGEVLVFQRPGVEPPVTTSPREIARNFFEGLGLVPPDGEIDLIKRVVGLPGERLKVINNRVYINGRKQHESFTNAKTPCEQLCNMPREITIPKGHYFMMGDNRGASADSREWGPVPKKWLIGQAFVTYWPPKKIGRL